MEDDSITVFNAEGDGVAVAQHVAIDPGAIHKNAIAVAAVLQAEAGALWRNRRAIARDAPIGKLQRVVAHAAAPNVERPMSQVDILPRTVGRDDFECSFGLRGK